MALCIKSSTPKAWQSLWDGGSIKYRKVYCWCVGGIGPNDLWNYPLKLVVLKCVYGLWFWAYFADSDGSILMLVHSIVCVFSFVSVFMVFDWNLLSLWCLAVILCMRFLVSDIFAWGEWASWESSRGIAQERVQNCKYVCMILLFGS